MTVLTMKYESRSQPRAVCLFLILLPTLFWYSTLCFLLITRSTSWCLSLHILSYRFCFDNPIALVLFQPTNSFSSINQLFLLQSTKYFFFNQPICSSSINQLVLLQSSNSFFFNQSNSFLFNQVTRSYQINQLALQSTISLFSQSTHSSINQLVLLQLVLLQSTKYMNTHISSSSVASDAKFRLIFLFAFYAHGSFQLSTYQVCLVLSLRLRNISTLRPTLFPCCL